MSTVRIVHFTGTGSTSLVASHLARAFTDRGLRVEEQTLRHGQPDLPGTPDLLVLAFAVHACNDPHPVSAWIKRLPVGWRTGPGGRRVPTPVAVVSKSGGGEVWPNLACRRRAIARLGRKGYRTVWEQMVVLPSNWIVQTPQALAVHLLDILPERLDRLVAGVMAGEERHSRPNLLDRLTSFLGRAEIFGARWFGQRIRVNEACTGCGICARGCPAGNIALRDRKPVFGKDCVLCLRCLYACPPQALLPGAAKFILVPQGYNLKALQARQPWTGTLDIDALTKGWIWGGIRRYLREN